MAYCILQKKNKNKNPINNLYIRVLLKRLSRYFQSTSSPIQKKKPLIKERRQWCHLQGSCLAETSFLLLPLFFHYEERNKSIVAVIILMYRCKTFIEVMNSHIVMVINEISIDKKSRFFFFCFTIYRLHVYFFLRITTAEKSLFHFLAVCFFLNLLRSLAMYSYIEMM